MKKLLVAILTAAAGLLISCRGPSYSVNRNDKGFFIAQAGTDERAFRIVTLPSGKTIKLIAVRKLVFAPGGDPPAMTLMYQTDIPIENTKALNMEALEIWASFQHDVDTAGLSSALITAAEPARGGATWQRRTFAFAFKKDSAGAWHSV